MSYCWTSTISLHSSLKGKLITLVMHFSTKSSYILYCSTATSEHKETHIDNVESREQWKVCFVEACDMHYGRAFFKKVPKSHQPTKNMHIRVMVSKGYWTLYSHA